MRVPLPVDSPLVSGSSPVDSLAAMRVPSLGENRCPGVHQQKKFTRTIECGRQQLKPDNLLIPPF